MDTFRKEQESYWAGRKRRREPHQPVIAAFAQPKIQRILEVTKLAPTNRVLDVGCGNGYFTHYFAKKNPTVGVDSSETMLRQNPHSDLVLADAEKLPFKDNSFELVFCSNLLHHVKDPLKVLLEMKRVSRKFIAVSEPNSLNPAMLAFELLVKEERPALKFNLAYLKKLFKKSRIQLIYAKSQGSIVPNKTPAVLLPLLKPLDFEQPFGFYAMCIGKK